MIVIDVDNSGKVIKDFSKAKFPEEIKNLVYEWAKSVIEQKQRES